MKIKILVLISALVSPLPAFAQTVTGIGTSNVQAADDFATRAFQDPWDMNQRTDVGPFLGSADLGSSGFTNISFASGVFSATTAASNAQVWLLDTGNPFAAPIGRIGTNYPIDAATYRVLAVRMSTSAARQIFIYSWDSNIYQSSPELIPGPATTTGYRTYLIDLAAAAPTLWTGTRGALRFDPAEGAAPVNVAIDWARLVSIDASLCRTISWSGASGSVNIYLDTDTDFGNGHLGPIALNVPGTGGASAGCSAAGANSYTFYAGALPAGMYRVAVVNAGLTPGAGNYSGGRWVVNDIPTLLFTSPNEEGSDDDFATSQLNNPWDMDSLGDVDLTRNVTSPQITSLTVQAPDGTSIGGQRVYRATSSQVSSTCGSVGDPQVEALHNNARGFTKQIDPNRYRIFTVEFGVPNRARDINCGSIARIVWRAKGDLGPGSVSDDLIFTSRAGVNMLDKITVDMKTLLVEQGTGAGGTNWVNGPSGGIDIFRFDPLEYPMATPFIIKRMKLTSLEQARTSYTIRWVYSEPSGTVDLFYDDNGSGFNGTPIANNVDATSGVFTWSIPAGLATTPARPVHIYAIFSDGTNENRVYAKWPILLDSTYNPRPRMVLNRSVLNYGITAGTLKTGPQTVRVNFTGAGGPACWTVVNSQPGIFTVSPTTGTGTGQFTISLVNTTFPGGGSGVGVFTVNECSANTILNPGLQVVANYRIWPASTAPAGVVETPANNATVAGSVAVTGWAVDDIDITGVRIYRMSGTTRVFIGNAVRVDDARPDVEGANPNSPFNYRGGWGYLLLSNFLPNFGDGQHVLQVWATDREGREAFLGQRTINGANSSSTAPFGAIDTPAQGATIGGTAYNNFGWVLARTPRFADPPHGGSVSVLIDNVAIGSPGGWTSRPDLAALFPAATYPGITNAAGVFTFDTTAYTNGVHTIAWVVFNNAGQGAGIGSRYFTIVNGAALTAAESAQANVIAPPLLVDPPPNLGRTLGEIAAVDQASAVRVSRGYSRRGKASAIVADITGVRTVDARTTDRLAIDASTPGARSYEAYLVANGRLRALPVGASFDERRGILYWQPGLGYAGAYDFAVVRDGRTIVPVRISVSSEPPHTSRTNRFMRGVFALGE